MPPSEQHRDEKDEEEEEQEQLQRLIPSWRWPDSAERAFLEKFLSDGREADRFAAILNGPAESCLSLLLVHLIRYYAAYDKWAHASSRTVEIADGFVSAVRSVFDGRRHMYQFQIDPTFLYSQIVALLVNMESDARGVFDDLHKEMKLMTRFFYERKAT